MEEHVLFPSITRADTDFFSKFIKMPWVQINLLCMLFRVPSDSEIVSSSSLMNCLKYSPVSFPSLSNSVSVVEKLSGGPSEQQRSVYYGTSLLLWQQRTLEDLCPLFWSGGSQTVAKPAAPPFLRENQQVIHLTLLVRTKAPLAITVGLWLRRVTIQNC